MENDPKSVLEGHDPQLERGVKEVMKMIAEAMNEEYIEPEDAT